MKEFQRIMKSCAAVLCAAAMILYLGGFTFEPSEGLETAKAAFTVGENGQTALENLAHTRPDWYPEVKYADGKYGLSACTTWQSPLMLNLDTEKFADIHKVRITVEWFDADHGRENNAEKFYRFRYVNTKGEVMLTGWLGSYQRTNQWRKETVEITDIDLSQTNLIRPGYAENLELLPDNKEAALPGEGSFYGLLVHSITVEPTETASYSLKQLDLADAAVYSPGGGSTDLSWVTSKYKPDTETRTVTDKAGITMVGKASSGGGTTNPDKECYLMVDPEKFKDVSAVNVAVTYLDSIDSAGNKPCVNIRWALRTEGAGTWGGWAKETGSTWTTASGLWKTAVYTLTDCDFRDGTKMSQYTPHNLSLYTTNNACDMNTPEDSSDDFYGLLIGKVEVTPLPEYTFTGLRFTDREQKELTALNPGGDFYTDLTVTRTGGTGTADVTVITMLCDGQNDYLERISYQTKKMEPDSSASFTNCFTNPEDAAGKYLRVMVWDSMQGMRPISNELICR